MKLSLAWIFDHINISWKGLNIDDLVYKIKYITAEVDSFKKINFDLDNFFLVRVKEFSGDNLILECPELGREIVVKEFGDYSEGAVLLLKKENDKFSLAKLADFYAEKEGFLPEFYCSEELLKGGWRDLCEREDYILEIDNKSITNRPDLWGHRGFAREIAAIIGVNLINESEFLVSCHVERFDEVSKITERNSVKIAIETGMCNRFAGMFVKDIKNIPSVLFVALRLLRINARPINSVVDFTNYVMFDWGQPMHAFDAEKVFGELVARAGKSGEKLELLDGVEIELSKKDCVISDSKKALSLAGIMGGASSGIDSSTKNLILESANFAPAAIRKSSFVHKQRTEASMRFEKGLDPNQNILGIMRFLKLLDTYKMALNDDREIVSVGPLALDNVIEVKHDFLEKKIGIKIDFRKVLEIFSSLGFGCEFCESCVGGVCDDACHHDSSLICYKVTVPTYRQDLKIKEDLLEEVSRFTGYDSVPRILPVNQIRPVDNGKIYKIREIKKQCAFGLSMRELFSYSFYDEAFLREIDFEPKDSPEIKNPVSGNYHRLITSLIPHLLKAIVANMYEQVPLRFFEWGSVWKLEDKILEKEALGLLWYEPKEELDFYEVKAELQKLFDLLDIKVLWEKFGNDNKDIWLHPYQGAKLILNGKTLGFAGKINPEFFGKFAKGDAFIAQLDGNILINAKKDEKEFKSLPKYQKVQLDVSMLSPLKISVFELEKNIKSVDSRIKETILIDHFERPEWEDKKAVTIRYVLLDDSKTLTKEEIDEVMRDVNKKVLGMGIDVR